MKRQTLVAFAGVAISAALVFAAVAVADNITGTQGDDVPLMGTPGDDHIVAKKGNDQVFALAGNDNVAGNKGNDILNGDEGNDTLSGKKGADQINGGTGSDLIHARGDGKKSGPDTITCGEDDGEYPTDMDTVKADKNDIVAADCEFVDRPGGGKPPKPPKP
jgi:Ca2+-binding RTX toxin-like protein